MYQILWTNSMEASDELIETEKSAKDGQQLCAHGSASVRVEDHEDRLL